MYDLIFADAWEGKFSHLDLALSRLGPGGLYVVDDLLPQPGWPEGHAARIPPFIRELENKPGFATLKLAWASGIIVVVRTGADGRP